MSCNSSSNSTEPARTPYTVQTSVPLTLLVGLLILLTVFGNVLVVIAVLTSRALRAPQNLFLVSLACADILVATLVMPFSLANELMGFWYFGQVWCDIYLALDVLFCTSSIAHLCAISLDRYWSVTKAIEYNAKRTPRRIKSIVLVVWVSAAIISCPPLLSMEKEGVKKEGPTCKINGEKWYILFSSTASFFAPCLIMILVYIRIYQVAKKRTRSHPGDRDRSQGAAGEQRGLARKNPQEKEEGDGERSDDGGERGDVNGLDVEECSSSDHNGNSPCQMKKKKRWKTRLCQIKPGNSSPRLSEEQQQQRTTVSRWKGRQNREKRFTFVLAVVMGVFVICWFPFFFTYTLTALCESCCVPNTLFNFFFWFGYCNSSLNPVIYTIFNNDFRRSFKKILCRRDRGRV